jgi:hypothetical protein
MREIYELKRKTFLYRREKKLVFVFVQDRRITDWSSFSLTTKDGSNDEDYQKDIYANAHA